MPITKNRRLRVLISAYACEPDKGSEPAVGWNFSKNMAKHHDVWVLTRANNRHNIEKELESNPVAGLHFFYHDLPEWISWWKSGNRGMQLYYYLWQISAISVIYKKHLTTSFDLSHHLTFVKYWAPSCLAWLRIPFIWGPVGGGEYTPRGLLKTLNGREKIFEFIKIIASRIAEFDPFVRKTSNSAVRIFASTKETAIRLKKMGLKRISIETQIGINDDEVFFKQNTNIPLIFVSIGRMIHWKGFILGLKAFSKLQDKKSQYWFIGDGPYKSQLEKYAQENNISDRVKFFGDMERFDVIQTLSQANVLVHPSYHDSAGLVCLEAMALGKPVICLDTGGPAMLINDVGFRCSTKSTDEAINQIHDAMKQLIENESVLSNFSLNAFNHLRTNFLWSTKTEKYAKIYRDVMNENQSL